MTMTELAGKLEKSGLPFAPIAKPEDLFDDPHLNASGGLVDVTIPDGDATRLPALPFTMGDERLGVRRDIPATGEDTDNVLAEAGYSETDIRDLRTAGIVE